MSDLLEDIISYIIANDLATQKDVDIFKDYTPGIDPDTCISILEYTGSPPAAFTSMSVRSIQITSRAKSKATARTKAWDLYKLMHKEDLYITLGSRICIIQMRNTPVRIDIDELGRAIYAFNVGITTNFD